MTDTEQPLVNNSHPNNIKIPSLLKNALNDSNRKKYGLNIIFANGDKTPMQKGWTKWQGKQQTDDDIKKMFKSSHTNYGYLTGFNGLIALDFDAAWIYREAIEYFEERLMNTYTVITPNGGYHAYFIVKNPQSYVKYKKSLKVELLGKMNALVSGQAKKTDGKLGNYTTMFNEPIVKDDKILEDMKRFLAETLTKYDFLTYNCIKEKLSAKITYLTHEQRLNLSNLFLQRKASIGVVIDFFKICEDFDTKISQKHIESTQDKINACQLGHPTCDNLAENFDWDRQNCGGCIRQKIPTTKVPPLLEEEKSDLTTRIVESVENSVTLFKNKGVAYGHYKVGEHYEIQPVRSKEFRGLLYELGKSLNKRKIPKTEVISNTRNYLEVLAYKTGEINLNNRVARNGNEFWIDLSNTEWSAVKINKSGWEIVDNPPILFKRQQHQKSQVNPSIEHIDLWKLFDYINIPNDKELLLLVWIIASFIPDIPHPLIVIYGPPGSGKSVLMEFLRDIINPSQVPKLRIPNGDKDLLQNFDHHYAPFFDNLDTIKPWLSDMICRAVTGEGSEYRQLYTDEGSVIRNFRRVIGLTGVNIPARKGDLLDRAILLGLIDLS